MVLRSILPLALLALVGCADPTPFRCDRVGAACAAPGACVDGYCAVPAADCASGRRYTSTAAAPGACTAASPPADAATDAPVDAPPDVAVDVPSDVAVDVPSDVAVDVPSDVPPDVAVDAPVDAPVDVPVDVPLDVVMDASIDATADAAIDGSDGSVDGPIDAGDASAGSDVSIAPPVDVTLRVPISSPGSAAAVVAMASADIDGDGRLDVAAARSDGVVELFRGTGDGRFTPAGTVDAPGVRALLLTDLVGDRHPELVTLGAELQIRAVLPSGAYGPPTTLSSTPFGMSLAVGQVMGTAARDLIVGVPTLQQVVVVPGPIGSDATVGVFAAPVRPDALAVVRLDNDGFDDLVVLSSAGSGNQVSTMPGSLGGPALDPGASLLPAVSGVRARGLVVGDYNADNRLDLVAVDDTGVTALANAGTGRLVATARVSLGAPIFGGVSGLLDADAQSDLVVLGEGDGLVHLFRSSDATPSPDAYAVPGPVVAAASGDFNGDNLDDLLVYADGLHVLAGHRVGLLVAPRALRTCPIPAATAVVDLDGDGTREVVVACSSAPALNVHRFTSALLPAGISTVPLTIVPTGLAAANVDADATADVLAWSRVDGRAQVVFGGATRRVGTVFTAGTHVAFGQLTTGTAIDLAAVNAARVSVLANADGTFGEVGARVDPLDRYVAVQVADFDGNAAPDVIALDAAGTVVTDDTNGVGALRGTPRTYAVRSGGTRLVAAPLGPLERPDLVVTFDADADVEVRRRVGTDLAVVGRSDTVGSAPRDVAVGDLTADRCPDVVTLLASGARLDVHAGDCSGALAPHVGFPSFAAGRVTATDFNGDGRVDLIVSHSLGAARTGYISFWISAAP